MTASPVFGIDLGTTYSCIAQIDRFGRPEVIRDMDGQATTPSVVEFDGDEVIVGRQAKNRVIINPDGIAQLVKRHIGDADWTFFTGTKDLSAPGVSALILGALAKDAERATGTPVRDVVITIPAYFGTELREATRQAGEIAGLNVLDIINEPTAAAYAYGFGQDGSGGDETILVYDLGGGTFDTTIIRLRGGDIEVITTDGDHELGGANWDAELAGLMCERFLAAAPDGAAFEDPFDDPVSEAALMTSAEEIKQSLSQRQTAETMVVSGGDRAPITITREDFEEATRALLERTIDLTRRTIDAAKEKGVGSIDRVLLVGGSSKMPAVAARLKEAFGYDGQLTDPDLAVSKGAALFGHKLALEQQVRDAEARGVAPAQALADAAAEHGMTTEAVTQTVQTRIVNVCSRGFGVIANDSADVPTAFFLVHQNDAIPTRVEQTFFTQVDDQTVIRVQVFEQGGSEESPLPSDNTILVSGEMTDLPPGWPRGTEVSIRMAMAANGILTVTGHHAGRTEPLTLQVDTTNAISDEQLAEDRAAVKLFKERL